MLVRKPKPPEESAYRQNDLQVESEACFPHLKSEIPIPSTHIHSRPPPANPIGRFAARDRSRLTYRNSSG